MTNTNPEDRFFNFNAETRAAIFGFQRTHDPSLVSPILHGILEKYLSGEVNIPAEPEQMLNGFAFESLTLVEIFLDLQDAFEIHISDEELRGLHSVDEVRALLAQKVSALRHPST